MSEDLIKQFTKTYGKGIVTTAEFIIEKPKKIHSLSPVLDIALSGGIPEGCSILCSGKPKCGKSTTALQFAAHCQASGRPVFYMDVECRIQGNQKLLTGIHGLDIKTLNIISSTPEKILSAVDHLTMAEEIAKGIPHALIILDSASALCDSSERTEELTANARVKGPKLLAAFSRRIKDVLSVNNINIFTIQHMIANTSGYGVPFMEDGGNKIVHGADVKIRAKGFSDWKDGESLIGQMVKWEVEFSALGPPGAIVESFIRYGHGIDEVWEIMNLATDLGLIEKSGAWYAFEGQKYQGQQNLWKALSDKEHPKMLNSLTEKVKSMTK